ncbi:hypothetical protein DFS34DRAFT_484624 [Phlyctochytrium arcticum]|nr:hypothetical protein DFS34DRAFT_484624 [Phlyctochytrium arcticum]
MTASISRTEHILRLAIEWARRSFAATSEFLSPGSDDLTQQDREEDTFYFDEAHPTKEEKEFQRYRHGFYRFYAELVKKEPPRTPSDKPQPPQTIDEREEFIRMLRHVKFDARISYGTFSFLVQIYLLYTTASRLSSCSLTLSPPPYTSPGSCPTHPFTFLDWVSCIQLAFYASTLLAHFLCPPVESFLFLHGIFAVNGAAISAWWFLNRETIASSAWRWLTVRAATGDMISISASTWKALWVPLLQWWLFLFARRRALAIWHWEHEHRLMNQDWEASEAAKKWMASDVAPDFAAEESCDDNSSERRPGTTPEPSTVPNNHPSFSEDPGQDPCDALPRRKTHNPPPPSPPPVFAPTHPTPRSEPPKQAKKSRKWLSYTYHQIWTYTSSALPLLLWSYIIAPKPAAHHFLHHHINFTPQGSLVDNSNLLIPTAHLPNRPGLFKLALIAWFSTWTLKVFFSFLHFQCAGIVWVHVPSGSAAEPSLRWWSPRTWLQTALRYRRRRRGLIFNYYEKEVQIGIIY